MHRVFLQQIASGTGRGEPEAAQPSGGSVHNPSQHNASQYIAALTKQDPSVHGAQKYHERSLHGGNKYKEASADALRVVAAPLMAAPQGIGGGRHTGSSSNLQYDYRSAIIAETSPVATPIK